MSEIAVDNVLTESADPANLGMCKEIAEYLVGAYPGYGWHVRIDGGMLILKSMKISPVWSMCRKYSDIAQDAGQRKRDVVMAAGEFLEAANLRRGVATGEAAKVLEGRKDDNKFQPLIIRETSL
jgi:hypothetical protein